ncbi:MAG: phosphoribosylamine--glycine ligase, partial [Candidatus Marinimicrobia bacterium]|nr:phosphoribosylamine--glycine ligase [Candidatus Neomarinimicrobiota bacterium]
VDNIYCAPGNAGTELFAKNVDIADTDIEGLLEFAKKDNIEMTFVGPEAPLVEGIVDKFEKEGLKVFGPSQAAAALEGSKVFSKKLMKDYSIPTAEYEVFTDPEKAISYIKKIGAPIVVKAEGLAAGKGVIVAETVKEAVDAVKLILVNDKFGEAGERIVVEEYLEGEEATVLAFVDGNNIKAMVPSQDHKPAYDNDKGPNTGGMGAYAPAPIVTDKLMEDIYQNILIPTVQALQQEGINYKGVLYCGLMIKDGKAKVLEYNVRFGDPEAQVVLPLLETDLVDIAEAVINEQLDDQEIKWKNKKALCVIMASGGYPIEYEKGKEITGIEEVNQDQDMIVFQAGTKNKNGKLLTDGGRVLAVTALGDDYKEVIDKAYVGVEKIHFDDFHIRNDIGQKALKHLDNDESKK